MKAADGFSHKLQPKQIKKMQRKISRTSSLVPKKTTDKIVKQTAGW